MQVADLYRYPVKGLSAERLEAVELEAGKPFPFDRVFALARANSGISYDQPAWAKKASFLMLMLEERLALARTRIDPATLQMTIAIAGKTIVTAPLNTLDGRTEVETLIGALARTGDASPRLLFNPTAHFMDKPDNVISLINLATVRDLEKRWNTSIDPLRFRANIYIDGAEAWDEFGWVGSDVSIGGVTFNVDRKNGRCGATNVNPVTGERDRDIPASLRTTFGHKDLGVYLIAKGNGRLAVNDPVQIDRPAPKAAPATAHHDAHPGLLICKGCYFIYDPVAQRRPFEQLPPDWVCPDCGADMTKFGPHTA
jgi:GntR family transcriptional regulator/MocR family aminotransferase